MCEHAERTRDGAFEALKLSIAIPCLGLALRGLLLATAERRLDCDESMTGVMALDIVSGRRFPMFFYGNSYNGGATLEAYLSAAAFSIYEPHAYLVKLAPTLIWFASALLFASLCNRVFEGNRRWFALTFYCLGTPFFIEWSMTARGGYVETLLVSVLLLWLTNPPAALVPRWILRTSLFGVVAGLSLWFSEMIVPFLPGATCWFLYRTPGRLRAKTVGALVLGVLLGLSPLIGYDLLNESAHLKNSLVFGLLAGGRAEAAPLDGSQLVDSLTFIFDPAPLALLALLGLGVAELIRARPSWNAAHVALAHVILYGLGYWWSGLRYLPIAPSRVLFVLLPSFALLAAWSLPESDEGYGRRRRVLAALLIAAWAIPSTLGVAAWSSSGLPRSDASWRASWALPDGDGLARFTQQNRIDQLYVSYWTATPITFSLRAALLRGEKIRPVRVLLDIPQEPPAAGRHSAIALYRGSPILIRVEDLLASQGIPHTRTELDRVVILSDLDSSQIHTQMGLPRQFTQNVSFAPLPESLDGFN